MFTLNVREATKRYAQTGNEYAPPTSTRAEAIFEPPQPLDTSVVEGAYRIYKKNELQALIDGLLKSMPVLPNE